MNKPIGLRHLLRANWTIGCHRVKPLHGNLNGPFAFVRSDRRDIMMGHIIWEVCQYLEGTIGRYRWDQWREAATALSIEVHMIADPSAPVGCLIENTILIREGMDQYTTALVAWHEICHAVLHAASPEAWRAKPAGRLMLRELERQCDLFVAMFPEWGE